MNASDLRRRDMGAGVYQMQVPAESQKIKCDIIFPATAKHVAKVGSDRTILSALGLGTAKADARGVPRFV